MEPEGSLPYVQEPATGPCTQPHEFSPHPLTLSLIDPIYNYPPIRALQGPQSRLKHERGIQILFPLMQVAWNLYSENVWFYSR
jgi:hypothetical protein